MASFLSKTSVILLATLTLSPAYAWTALSDLTAPEPASLTLEERRSFNDALKLVVDNRHQDAVSLFTPLANKGVSEAQVGLSNILALSQDAYAKKQSVKWAYFAALDDNWHGQIRLGKALRDGEGVEQDLFFSRFWLERALSRGGMDAVEEINKLDLMAWNKARESLSQNDPRTAAALLHPLADKGNHVAQDILGHIYLKNAIVPDNQVVASHWLNLAANNGIKSAQYSMAMMTLKQKDENPAQQDKAFEWLQKAAEPGNPDAQFQLGMLYLNKLEQREGQNKGIHWYRLAAEQGHAEAQYSLGVRYALGRDVDSDASESHRWFKRAAEQGHAKAQHNLALSYFYGVGVPQDKVSATFWFQKAASQGIEKSVEFAENKTSTPTKPSLIGANIIEKRYTALEGWDWFNEQPAEGYTVQVIYSRENKSAVALREKLKLDRDFFQYRVESPQKTRHVIHYGHFATHKDAEVAALALSQGETIFKPWIRKMSDIKRKFPNAKGSE